MQEFESWEMKKLLSHEWPWWRGVPYDAPTHHISKNCDVFGKEDDITFFWNITEENDAIENLEEIKLAYSNICGIIFIFGSNKVHSLLWRRPVIMIRSMNISSYVIYANNFFSLLHLYEGVNVHWVMQVI